MTPRDRFINIGGGLGAMLVANVILIASALLIDVPATGLTEFSLWVMGLFGCSLTVAGWIAGALLIRMGLRRSK